MQCGGLFTYWNTLSILVRNCKTAKQKPQKPAPFSVQRKILLNVLTNYFQKSLEDRCELTGVWVFFFSPSDLTAEESVRKFQGNHPASINTDKPTAAAGTQPKYHHPAQHKRRLLPVTSQASPERGLYFPIICLRRNLRSHLQVHQHIPP